MNELALFAGAGGGLYGSKLLGWRTVCAVEINKYRQRVLLQRQRDGVFDLFPIWDDVRTFDGRPWRGGVVDIVTGGFPCQPFSQAGKREAEADARNLWPETARILREVRPRFALLENVPRLVRYDYFGHILGDLASLGFNVEWDVISAAECGAPHLRKRLWILADAEGPRSGGLPVRQGGQKQAAANAHGNSQDGAVADSASSRCEGGTVKQRQVAFAARREGGQSEGRACLPSHGGSPPDMADSNGGRCQVRCSESKHGDIREIDAKIRRLWRFEPDVGRVANGVADWGERISALGDGQVPAVVVRAWRTLSSLF